MNPLSISDTLCDVSMPEALPPLIVDEPTVSMTFCVNDSPFAGREGKYVTSRQLAERLDRELLHNVALRVKQGDTPDKFIVSGRGELHLSILIENMRREGYEVAVSRPEIIIKEIDGVLCEPFESVIITVDQAYQGVVMEMLGERQGQLKDMIPETHGRFRLSYMVPSRGLIGFHTGFLTETSGTGVLHHTFDHYGPMKVSGHIGGRRRGAMIANMVGKAIPFSMFNLQERGTLIVEPSTEVYEGMIVGIHSRDNDLVVNICRTKQLTNIRSAGNDENILITPPAKPTLEQALEMINDDELVEITPQSIRLRKKRLKETDRKRDGRSKNGDI
jgi:GTP-binding protein